MAAELAPIQEPRLFDQFAETEVTVFGITDTLQNLILMCPVPAEQLLPEDVDRFTATVLQEAGIEVPPEFAHLVEPKPDAAEQSKPEPAAEKPKTADVVLAAEAARQQNEIPQDFKTTLPEVPDDGLYRLQQLMAAQIAAQQFEAQIGKPAPANKITEKKANKETPAQPKTPVFPRLSVVKLIRKETAPAATAEVQEIPVVYQAAPTPEIAQKEADEADSQALRHEIETAVLLAEPELQDEGLRMLNAEVAWDISPVELEFEKRELADEIGLREPMIEDEAWIQELFLPLPIEALEELPTAPEKILHSITENREVTPRVVEQTENLLEVIPESVQEILAEYLEINDPEQVEAVQEMVVNIAVMADRLHELATTGKLESEEATQIRQLILEQYEALLTQLEIEYNQEMLETLIAQICSDDYSLAESKAAKPFNNIFMERKDDRQINILSLAKFFIQVTRDTELKIASLMVRRSLAPAVAN
jgi:hypothetical protein